MPTPSLRSGAAGGRACRAGLREGGWRWRRGEGWGKGLALERRRREWAQLGENRGTRIGACTDISPTSLHKRKQHVPWCRRLLSTGFAGLETNTIWIDIRTRRFWWEARHERAGGAAG